ncbi:MAG: S8 family serine peptidase, partial [Planctomycetota bacterium]
IAIIDDSIEKSHPDLSANFQAGRHYVGANASFDDDPSPRNPEQKHGTACAGVAVAVANDIGVRGVAPRCGLIGVHMWDTNDDLQTADAFYFSADPDGDSTTDDGAAVISCSWSIVTDEIPVEISSAVDDLVRNGRGGKGMVILFAAGNEGDEIAVFQKLGARESVICVGATNFRDVQSWYSNFGPELDVMAPSNDDSALSIETTDNSDDQPRFPNNDRSGYAVGDYTGNGNTGFGGTSSATPLAAGVCGMILSANPNLTSTQVRGILEHACDRVRGPSWIGDIDPTFYEVTTGHNIYYGYGRVNASKAVMVARESLTNPDAIWPDHVQQLAASSISPGQTRLSWRNPPNNVAGVLVVRSAAPVLWKPHDAERYRVSDTVGDGTVQVVNIEPVDQLDIPSDTTTSAFIAVFPFSADHRYSWGQVVQLTPSIPIPAMASGPHTSPGTKFQSSTASRRQQTYQPSHEARP